MGGVRSEPVGEPLGKWFMGSGGLKRSKYAVVRLVQLSEPRSDDDRAREG